MFRIAGSVQIRNCKNCEKNNFFSMLMSIFKASSKKEKYCFFKITISYLYGPRNTKHISVLIRGCCKTSVDAPRQNRQKYEGLPRLL